MWAVTGKPIKFVGVGERLEDLEVFHPDRLASRILGMGDVVSLVEKTQLLVDKQQAEKLDKKLRREGFDLLDLLDQLRNLKRIGSLQSIFEYLPRSREMKGFSVDERELTTVEAIICSMTPEERANVKIINGNRRQRIARGSGTSVSDVNRLINNFIRMQKIFKSLKRGDKIRGRFNIPFIKICIFIVSIGLLQLTNS